MSIITTTTSTTSPTTVCREGCKVVRTIYMVCAHTSRVSHWTSLCQGSNNGRTCMPASRAEVRFGWCPACTAFYAPIDLNDEALIRNYWAFKTAHGIFEPLDNPGTVPIAVLMRSSPETAFTAATTMTEPRTAEIESLACALVQASSGACSLTHARVRTRRYRVEMLKWAAKRRVSRGRGRSSCRRVDKPLPPVPCSLDLTSQPQHSSFSGFEMLKPRTYSPPLPSPRSATNILETSSHQDSTSINFCWHHCAIVAPDGACHECDQESIEPQMRGRVKSLPMRDREVLRLQVAKQIAASAVQPLCLCDNRGFECTPCTDRRISSKAVGTEQWI